MSAATLGFLNNDPSNPLATRVGSHRLTKFAGELVRSYIPVDLPPVPPVVLEHMHLALERANQGVGRLDGVSSLIPDISLFLYGYIRREAVLSSQIEGTQSSLSDLLLFENEEAPGVPIDDVQEVCNYVAAMNHGLRRMQGGFPLSLRLIREIHGILLSQGRGAMKTPGEFRTSQNWIGGTRPGNAFFVPPPPDEVPQLMGKLEKFLNEEAPKLPVLVRAGLIHVQFETIHPFLDGNGRLGRLLISLQLCQERVLREPLLYLSLFLKKHRDTYYQLLTTVRNEGRWEDWLDFFLEGIHYTSNEGVSTAVRLQNLFRDDERRVLGMGKGSDLGMQIFRNMQAKPVFSMKTMSKLIGKTFPTTAAAVGKLEKMGMVREITGRERDRVYSYYDFVRILNEDTERVQGAS